MANVLGTKPIESRSIERGPTRIVSGLVGGLFVVGPLVSPLIYSNQAAEIRTASVNLLVEYAILYILCAAVGILFLGVAIKGKAPQWLKPEE